MYVMIFEKPEVSHVLELRSPLTPADFAFFAYQAPPATKQGRNFLASATHITTIAEMTILPSTQQERLVRWRLYARTLPATPFS